MSRTQKIVNLLAAPLVLILAVLLAKSMIAGKKSPPVRPPEVVAVRLEILASSPATVRPEIASYGTTQAYLTTSLSSQVSGEILSLAPAFEVGKRVEKGELLVRLDPLDYESALSQREASLSQARQDLIAEETEGRIAREDWLATGRQLTEAPAFTLREPQLAAAQAAVAAAEANVAQAKADLERTAIRAPFDALVATRSASPGNIVANGSELGSLISAEKLEVRLPLTPAQAARLDLPGSSESGEPLRAEITSPSFPGARWQATISRLDPQVDRQNQTLYLIGEIERPFDHAEGFLPTGTFVNARLQARPLAEVHELPEMSVVEDSYVWLVTSEQTLVKQPIEIAHTQNGRIFARIAEPVAELPLPIVKRPLASLQSGQKVEVVTSEAP